MVLVSKLTADSYPDITSKPKNASSRKDSIGFNLEISAIKDILLVVRP